jgi:hypothetical protein
LPLSAEEQSEGGSGNLSDRIIGEEARGEIYYLDFATR